jgi:hypothetical protein
MTTRTGHCLCGAVGFTITPLNPEVGTCHCKMCQRWAGSALLAMETPADSIKFTGESHIKRCQSSDWAERAWCTECGSSLWYRVTTPSATPHPYEIPIGLLDDTAGLTMTREIYVDEKAELVDFSGDRETLTTAECLALYAGNKE